MRRYLTGTVILVAGLLFGIPMGYMMRGGESHTNRVGGNEMQLTFNRDYFEKLPTADSDGQRLINVGTFYFDTDGDGTPDPSSALTVPLDAK